MHLTQLNLVYYYNISDASCSEIAKLNVFLEYYNFKARISKTNEVRLYLLFSQLGITFHDATEMINKRN